MSPSASEDVDHIVDSLLVLTGFQVADRAERVIYRGLESLERLADRGRYVLELKDRGYVDYREIMRGPYRIIYRVEGQQVWVLAVLDHRRDLDQLLQTRARRDRSNR